ncbi:hypothetical protein OC842_006314 [Tilletia horrida]|uniref:DUF2421 domain-containing protein n=1 Tax=Tilletia horrida TaxID=155126 RepID=A0AAN6G667_9BASI|nr:hypothetical protein OC842_006314 [Tilletia horrida]
MATDGDDGSAQGPATRIESSASLRVQLSRSSTTGYGTLDAGTSAGTAPARTGARTPHSRSVSAQELGNPSAADRDAPATPSPSASPSARRNLWRAVESSISAANALRHRAAAASSSTRSREHDDQGRVDAEGMSGTLRPLSGSYADHWQSLAHLFEQPQSPANARGPGSSYFASHNMQTSFTSASQTSAPGSPLSERRQRSARATSHSRSRTPTRSSLVPSAASPSASSILSASWSRQHSQIPQPVPEAASESTPRIRTAPLPDISQRQSFSAEPESMLDSDPDCIPDSADPLEYADGDDLLDDDSEEEDEENAHRLAQSRQQRFKASSWTKKIEITLKNLFAGEILSLNQKGISYYIAELFTFSESLSDWTASLLPNHDPDAKVPFSNLHMIATIAVYFHPAKTLGAMLEADVFALLAFLYSLALGLSSMEVAVWLHGAGHPILSNAISVLLFLGVGMGLVGYSKVKVGKPTFNTACSMIGVIVFTVIAKEGSAHLGVFSADKIWQSACTNLQEDIVRNLSGFSTLLKVLTKTFLLDDPSQFHYNSERIKRAIDNHHASFISLRKNLQEARMEAALDARVRHVSDRYIRVVDSMNRLAQHLTGLRSSCGLQHQIMVDRQQNEMASSYTNGQGAQVGDDPFANPRKSHGEQIGSQRERKIGSETLQAHASSFEHFASNIGPHMRSLVVSTGIALGTHSDDVDRRPSTVSLGSNDFSQLIEDLAAALRRFQTEQTVSIKRMYTLEPSKGAAEEMKRRATMMLASLSSQNGNGETNSDGAAPQPGPTEPMGEFANRYGADINPDEEVFLVFFFVFNLEEFAKEISVLLRELAAIRKEEDRIARNRKLGWWKFGQWEAPPKRDPAFSDGTIRYGKASSWIQRLFRRGSWQVSPSTHNSFPSSRRHQLDTAQTPKAQTFRQKVQRIVWTVGELLRQPDTKFAIKTGLGAAALAAPAFISATRPLFTEYQGQWALVSFMVVLSPTVGQSNQMSLHRVVGTIFGALVAYGAYTVFPDNHIALPIVGVIFSLPCFRYIVAKPQYASSARFVLLTYNLTALYSYNLRIVGIEVEQIAFHRTIAVIAGVVWASLLNHIVWPFEARRELGLGVSDLLFKLAWLYQRLVLTYSSQDATVVFDEDEEIIAADAEVQPLLRSNKQDRVSAEFQAIELHLQLSIIKLEGLLAQTRHEPRLKGPFPISTYKSLLGCCQAILDKLHSMRCVTARDAWHRNVRRDFVIPVNAQRREMVGNVLLFFWLLGSAFHLKTPMPPYMPPVKSSREALIERIRELPAVKRRAIRGSSEYLLFYSYVLAMKDVIDQLLQLGEITQQLFGVLGGSTDAFEAQFRAAADSSDPTPRTSRLGSLF